MQATTGLNTSTHAQKPKNIIRELSDHQRATSTSMMTLEYLIRAIGEKRPQWFFGNANIKVYCDDRRTQWWHTPQQELAAAHTMYEALRIALDGGRPDPGVAYQANFEQALGAHEARNFCPELHHCLAKYLEAKARGDEPGFYFQNNRRWSTVENLRTLHRLAIVGEYYIPQENMLADLYEKCA